MHMSFSDFTTALLLLAAFLFFFKRLRYRSPEELGTEGEKRIAKMLSKTSFMGYGSRLLQNLYVPSTAGVSSVTSEIDLLYLTPKGLIVIESKNFSGYIFGNDVSAQWTVSLSAGRGRRGKGRSQKYHFYNPIWQNSNHIKNLIRFLGDDIPCISVIVFSDRCALMDINWNAPGTYICQLHDLTRLMRDISNAYPNVLSAEQIDRIYAQLLPLTCTDAVQKELHTQQIEYRFHESPVCPVCGAPLVLRTVKHGPNIGLSFYGCSNYPNCRYTRDL